MRRMAAGKSKMGRREEQEGHERNPGRQNKGGEGHPLTRSARASARNRRVFLSLDVCIVPYFSPELTLLMCCFACIRLWQYRLLLKSSRRLFVFKARTIWHDFFLKSDRSLRDLPLLTHR